MSRLILTKRHDGSWSYQEKSVGLVLPTNTQAFMEAHLGICKGNQHRVDVTNRDEPTTCYYIHVIAFKIVKVERVDFLNDGSGTVLEVRTCEFDS